VFDLVNLANNLAIPDSSHKRIVADALPVDPDGSETTNYLATLRAILWRLCSTHASSLGLHPALYFYSTNGTFQPTALLSFVALFKEYDTAAFMRFIEVRENFEEFLMAHRSITEAVRQLGSGSRSRPRVLAFYGALLQELRDGKSPAEARAILAANDQYAFLFADAVGPEAVSGSSFRRQTKGAAYLRDAMPTALKCPTCGGRLHRNGMQTGHIEHKREGGTGDVGNAMIQHPFCNSTVTQ
jgi:hypothetical protein